MSWTDLFTSSNSKHRFITVNSNGPTKWSPHWTKGAWAKPNLHHAIILLVQSNFNLMLSGLKLSSLWASKGEHCSCNQACQCRFFNWHIYWVVHP